MPDVASIRERPRADGTIAYAVLYSLAGRQSALTFDDKKAAGAFKVAVEAHGAERALQMYGINTAPRRRDPVDTMTVAYWVGHHIDHLSGIERRTRAEYKGVLAKDIAPTIGLIPLAQLSSDDISRWLESLRDDGAAGKTIANKHGLLSAALNTAVRAKHIRANPAAGIRLPRTVKREMRFLSRAEFALLVGEITEPWRPMVRFLVTSGARLSEVTALRPADVDRRSETVRIWQAWKRGPGGYQLGPPKTRKSVRTINIPAAVLDELDYSGEYLFTNPGRGRRGVGGPVRPPNFRANVWHPAVDRAVDKGLALPRPRIHDLRHTCASWLIQRGIPLPVIQQHLGHESIEVTVGVYGHLDRRSAAAAADVMAQLLAGDDE